MLSTPDLVFIAAVAGAPLALVAGVVAWRSSRRPGRTSGDHAVRVLAATLLTVGTVLIVVATLYPARGFAGGWMSGGVNLEPFDTIDRYRNSSRLALPVIARNLLGNVVLFVPLGTGVALAARRWGATVGVLLAAAIGALASATVEALQWLLPLERSVDIDDVILNAAGAVLGGLAGAILLRVLGRSRAGAQHRAVEALRS